MYILLTLQLLSMRVAGSFLIYAGMAEIPTVILALGSIWSRLRSDLSFGASFFITRILLHAHCIYQAYLCFTGNFWIFPCLPFPLHVMWFRGWYATFTARKQRAGAAGGKGKESPAASPVAAAAAADATPAATTTASEAAQLLAAGRRPAKARLEAPLPRSLPVAAA